MNNMVERLGIMYFKNKNDFRTMLLDEIDNGMISHESIKSNITSEYAMNGFILGVKDTREHLIFNGTSSHDNWLLNKLNKIYNIIV